MSEANPRNEAQNALKQADAAARRGDLSAAERWSKTAERMVAAAERVTALPRPDDNEEARCAELRRRLEKFVRAQHDFNAWEAERDAYDAAVASALANGTEFPPPLRANPSAPWAVEEWLERIAKGEESSSPSMGEVAANEVRGRSG